jgi:hypothetical protein
MFDRKKTESWNEKMNARERKSGNKQCLPESEDGLHRIKIWSIKRNIGYIWRPKTKTHRYAETKRNNVNKTYVLLQTTGDKDETNIVIIQKSFRTSQHGTQNLKTHNSRSENTHMG